MNWPNWMTQTMVTSVYEEGEYDLAAGVAEFNSGLEMNRINW